MDLKEFVRNTLIQIAEGVTEAHQHIATTYNGDGVRDEEHQVTFDVAVVTDEEEKKEAGGGIKVASVFSVKGGTEAASKSSNQSRVQFSVHIHIPTNRKPKYSVM